LAGTSDETLNFQDSYTVPILASATGSGGNECQAVGAPVKHGVCQASVTGISPYNTNATTTGIPAFKTGARTLNFAVKYFF